MLFDSWIKQFSNIFWSVKSLLICQFCVTRLKGLEPMSASSHPGASHWPGSIPGASRGRSRGHPGAISLPKQELGGLPTPSFRNFRKLLTYPLPPNYSRLGAFTTSEALALCFCKLGRNHSVSMNKYLIENPTLGDSIENVRRVYPPCCVIPEEYGARELSLSTENLSKHINISTAP